MPKAAVPTTPNVPNPKAANSSDTSLPVCGNDSLSLPAAESIVLSEFIELTLASVPFDCVAKFSNELGLPS